MAPGSALVGGRGAEKSCSPPPSMACPPGSIPARSPVMLQGETRCRQPEHASRGETFIEPYSTDPGNPIRKLRLQAAGARKGEGGTHCRPEESGQHRTGRGSFSVGATLAMQCRQPCGAQEGPEGNGLRIMESCVRRPVRIKQVRAIPIDQKSSHRRGTGDESQDLAPGGHRVNLRFARADPVACRRRH